MSRSGDLLYFGNMLDMARKLVQKLPGLTRARLVEDEDLCLALLHRIQTIGEAARRVSEKRRTERPEIPWSLVVGMHNVIVHDYMNTNMDELWQTLTRDIPVLCDQLARFVAPDPPE